MKKLKIVPLFLLFCLLLCNVAPMQALALDEPAINSNVAMVINSDTGEVFYSKNADWKVYPASTTKIMTVFLAIEAIEREEVSLYDEVTAGSSMTYDLIDDGSSAGIVVGETMTLENLLYCAMVSSANEACNVIAQYISGSVSDFVALMNSRARELGCVNTSFTNTHGLPDENHYTTAEDFKLIARAATSSELFMRICNTASVTIPATNMSEARDLVNSNALITESSVYGSTYYYENAIGIKTGYTSAAGYCLVSTAIKNDISLLALVFGGQMTDTGNDTKVIDSFNDTVTLYEWVFENYSYQEVLKNTDIVKTVDVVLGSNSESVGLHSTTSITALLPNDYDPSEFTRTITIFSEQEGEELRAPISAGDVLGEMTVSRGGINYGTVKLVAAQSVDLSYFQYMRQTISDTLSSPVVIAIIVIILLLIIAYIIIVVRYRIRRRRHLKALTDRRGGNRQSVPRDDTFAPKNETPATGTVSGARKAPSVEYFSDDGDDEDDEDPGPATSGGKAMDEKTQRDYFEEFFKH